MSAHRGDLRLTIEGETFERSPEEVTPGGPAPGSPVPTERPVEVRPIPPTAADRAAGVRRYEATVGGWVFQVAAEDEARARLRERAAQGSGGTGPHHSDLVAAQLPGRVSRLWVAEGDTVETGQRLLAVEAMKMENEVRAPRAGTVERIIVAVDDRVELGDELVRLG